MLKRNFLNKQRERGGGVHRDRATEKGQDQRPSRGDEVSKPTMKAEGYTDRKTDRQTEICLNR